MEWVLRLRPGVVRRHLPRAGQWPSSRGLVPQSGGSVTGKSGVSTSFGEIRCQRGNSVSAGKSGVSTSFLPEKTNREIRGKSGVSGGNPVSVHHSGNPVSVHHGNPVSVHHSRGKSGVSSSFSGKSGVSSSFSGEIRCQFIILARMEIRCQFIILGGNPVSVRGKSGGKSGVSSSFLPEKTNRHRAKKLGRGG